MGSLYETFEQQIKERIKEKLPMYHGSKYCEEYKAKNPGNCINCEGFDGCDAKDFSIFSLYLTKHNAGVPDTKIITGEFVEEQSKEIDRIINLTIKESERKNPNMNEKFKKLNINI